MGSIVAELAEKITSATNSFDIDEQTLYVNTSADTVGIGTNSPDGKLSVHQSGTDDIFNLYDGTTNILTVADGGTLTHKGTLLVGVDDTGHDVKFFGDTSGKYWMWDTSADGTVQVGNSQLTGTFTVGVDNTGHDVKFFGATSGAYMLWDESADDLILAGASGLSISGTGSLTVASGNVGIGDTSPASLLGLKASSASATLGTAPGINVYNAGTTGDGHGSYIWFSHEKTAGKENSAAIYGLRGAGETDGDLQFAVRDNGSWVTAMHIDGADGGKVGIGTTSPSQNLDVLNTAQITGAEGTSASLYLVSDEGDDNGDGWRINSNQDVNDLTISNNTTGSYVDKLTIATNGDVTATGDMNAVDFNATSDATLKENIRPLDDVLSLIENINTYKFNWIESKGGKESVGVLAQELKNVLPSAVNTNVNNDQEHMTVNYNQITSVLIQAVKELSNKVKELSAK